MSKDITSTSYDLLLKYSSSNSSSSSGSSNELCGSLLALLGRSAGATSNDFAYLLGLDDGKALAQLAAIIPELQVHLLFVYLFVLTD